MKVLKIELEEQLLTKYYVIKHLILLKIQSMMDINADLRHCFINFLIKRLQIVKNESFSNKELAKNLPRPIIRKFGKRKITITFYGQYLGHRPSSYAIDKQTKEFVFYYVLLIFSVNTYGLFI